MIGQRGEREPHHDITGIALGWLGHRGLRHHPVAARPGSQRRRSQRNAAHHVSIDKQFDPRLEPVGVGERVPVVQPVPARAGIHGLDHQVAIAPEHLASCRVLAAVGAEYPVRAEISMGGGVAEVPAVQPLVHAFVGDSVDRLVDVVPDEPPGHVAVAVEDVDVLPEVAQAVLHRVGVFTQQHGAPGQQIRRQQLVVGEEAIRDDSAGRGSQFLVSPQPGELVGRGVHA